jgi:hypothetical protein
LFIANERNVFEKPRTPFTLSFITCGGVISDLVEDEITLHGLSGEIPAGLKQKNIKSIVTIHDLIFYVSSCIPFDRKIHYFKFKRQQHMQTKSLQLASRQN